MYKRQDLAKLKQEKLKVMSPKYKQKLKEIRKKLRKVDEDFHNKELELENYNGRICIVYCVVLL